MHYLLYPLQMWFSIFWRHFLPLQTAELRCCSLQGWIYFYQLFGSSSLYIPIGFAWYMNPCRWWLNCCICTPLCSRLEKCSKNQFQVVTCNTLHLGSLMWRQDFWMRREQWDRDEGQTGDVMHLLPKRYQIIIVWNKFLVQILAW